MPPSEGETHWPPGPNGCCCPSSPKISLKSSSSFPGQFAVVIGFDSSGFLTPATRPSTAGAVYALLKKMSQHLPTATTPNLNFCSFNSRINNACVSPPPSTAQFDKSTTRAGGSPLSLFFLRQLHGAKILASTSEKVAPLSLRLSLRLSVYPKPSEW